MAMSWICFIVILCVASVSGQFNVYWGNLHSHTSYSDGEGTPAQAFAYARDVAHLDFLAVTDHLEQIYFLPWNWNDTKAQANAVTIEGTFVGIAGYEWGSPLYNHCNVFNTPNMVTPTTYLDWLGFTEDVLDEHPAFGQFNHPEETEYILVWNWFAYVSPAVDSAFPLIEVKNAAADSFYRMALDSGWHVAPVANQDNHDDNWGTANDHRAGIWATELTRPALFEAIMARRTFSTQDKNASVWIELDEHPMGSSVARDFSMRFRIIFEDADAETFSTVIVKGGGGVTFLTLSNVPAPLDTRVAITPHFSRWIYVLAQQKDNDLIWSAPIFITGEPLLVASADARHDSLLVAPNPTNGMIHIYATTGLPDEPEFYDISGHIVTRNVRQISKSTYHLGDLPVGTYIIRWGEKTKRILLAK